MMTNSTRLTPPQPSSPRTAAPRWSAAAPADEAAPRSGEDPHAILQAALALLAQGEEILAQIPPALYARKLPQAFNASIGGHYRHCLDHFTSLLRGLDTAEIDYDLRDRDPRVETDPAQAAALTRRLREELAALPVDLLAQPLRIRCEVWHGHPAPDTGSTLGRELVYAIAHSIHHHALIAVMARLLGLELPPQFGVAPSTLTYQGRQGR